MSRIDSSYSSSSSRARTRHESHAAIAIDEALSRHAKRHRIVQEVTLSIQRRSTTDQRTSRTLAAFTYSEYSFDAGKAMLDRSCRRYVQKGTDCAGATIAASRRDLRFACRVT